MPRINWPSRETWLATLLFTALTVLLAYPLSIHPSSLRFPSGPDGEIGWYLLAWDTHAFLHKPWAIFNANIYYPQALTLAYGENIIGIALFAAPVIWLTGDVVLAANFASLLSCILCGVGAYVLARRLGLSVAAAILCGIIFECAPPRFFRIGQINLSNVQWIPFGLAALHGYLDTGRKRDLHLAAGFMSLEALSSGHGAVFMAVSMLLLALYRLALGEPIRLMTRVRDLGLTGFLLLLPPILMFLPYRAVQQEVGLRRGLGTWEENYSSFIASPSHLHKYIVSFFTDRDLNATALAFLFPGYLPIALAIPVLVIGGLLLARRFRMPDVFRVDAARHVQPGVSTSGVVAAGWRYRVGGAGRSPGSDAGGYRADRTVLHEHELERSAGAIDARFPTVNGADARELEGRTA